MSAVLHGICEESWYCMCMKRTYNSLVYYIYYYVSGKDIPLMKGNIHRYVVTALPTQKGRECYTVHKCACTCLYLLLYIERGIIISCLLFNVECKRYI